jgi:hypothetical protein
MCVGWSPWFFYACPAPIHLIMFLQTTEIIVRAVAIAVNVALGCSVVGGSLHVHRRRLPSSRAWRMILLQCCVALVPTVEHWLRLLLRHQLDLEQPSGVHISTEFLFAAGVGVLLVRLRFDVAVAVILATLLGCVVVAPRGAAAPPALAERMVKTRDLCAESLVSCGGAASLTHGTS